MIEITNHFSGSIQRFRVTADAPEGMARKFYEGYKRTFEQCGFAIDASENQFFVRLPQAHKSPMVTVRLVSE